MNRPNFKQPKRTCESRYDCQVDYSPLKGQNVYLHVNRLSENLLICSSKCNPSSDNTFQFQILLIRCPFVNT